LSSPITSHTIRFPKQRELNHHKDKVVVAAGGVMIMMIVRRGMKAVLAVWVAVVHH
jgi:hypothetical protein